jgi:hypothetical protein
MVIFLVFMAYAGIGAVVLLVGIIFYLRSVASRKRYCCPQCGEQLQVELMKAEHCNMCGAPLRREMMEAQP